MPASSYEQTLQFVGGNSQRLTVPVPANKWVLALLREQGAHGTLSVAAPDGKNLVVDTPVRRSGLQAVWLAPASTRALTIVVSSQEPRGYAGNLGITVSAFPNAPTRGCMNAWRSFTAAGVDYAQAQELRKQSKQGQSIATELQSSLDNYRRAQQQFKSAGDESMAAQALLHAAWITYQDLNRWDEALQLATAATDALAPLDAYSHARARALRAEAMLEISTNHDEARRLLGESAEYHAAHQQVFEQARALNNIGLSFHYQGRYEEAQDYYSRASRLYESLHDAPNAARSLQNTAVVEYELARFSECSRTAPRALQQFERNDDPQLYGDILNNLATCEFAARSFDAAIRHYLDAYEIHQTLQNNRASARTLQGLGSTYYAMGDLDRALQFYSQALPLRPAALDPRGHAATLRAMGNIQRELGNMDEAIRLYTAALNVGLSPSIQRRTRLFLARILIEANRLEEARKLIDASVKPPGAPDAPVEALLQLEQGRLLTAAGSWQAAREPLQRAVEAFGQLEMLTDQADALQLLVRALATSGDLANALAAADRGIAISERTRLQSANPELRAGLFAPWRRFYDLKLSLLVTNHPLTTLRIAEQSRYRTLQDYLADDAVDPAATQKRAALLRQLSLRQSQIAVGLDRVGAEDPKVRQLKQEIFRLRAEVDTLNRVTPAEPSQLLDGDVRKLQSQLGKNTAVIAYWIGDEIALAWVITPTRISTVRLANPAAITSAALMAHRVLASPSSDDQQVRRALADAGRLIVDPIASAAPQRQWIVVPDGALHHVPFAALTSKQTRGKRDVLAAHDISFAPTVSLLAQHVESTPTMPRTALLVADPVFELSDSRFTPGSPAADSKVALTRAAPAGAILTRLPASEAEVAALANQLQGTTVTQLTGFDATRERFIQANLRDYDLIHIATHAFADLSQPQLSSLALSRYTRERREIDPYITLNDLLSLRLNARYVVLSACETAQGKAVPGEGLMGLSYGLLARGAHSVVASRWRVPDRAAADFMKYFYDALLIERLPAPGALTQASLKLKHSRLWSSPRYWAAFAVYETTLMP